MLSMEVVVVEPWVELLVAFLGVLVGAGVGPLSERGLDEAFGFSIGAWGIGSGKAVLEAGGLDDLSEAPVAIAGAVIGEDSPDREAEAGEVGPRHVEEHECGTVLLVGQDGSEADAAVIVDGDVQVLVSGAARLPRSIAVNAVSGLDDAGQALDIEVDEVAWAGMFVAHDRGRRIERLEPVHAVAAQNAADGGAAEMQGVGDPAPVVAQLAKSQNLFQ